MKERISFWSRIITPKTSSFAGSTRPPARSARAIRQGRGTDLLRGAGAWDVAVGRFVPSRQDRRRRDGLASAVPADRDDDVAVPDTALQAHVRAGAGQARQEDRADRGGKTAAAEPVQNAYRQGLLQSNAA